MNPYGEDTNPDLLATEVTPEMHNFPCRQTNAEEVMNPLLINSPSIQQRNAPLGSFLEEEADADMRESEQNRESKVHRRSLPGASQKRLRGLLKSGVPYQTAMRKVLDGIERRQAERSNADSAGGSNRSRFRTAPEQAAKRPRTQMGSTSYRTAASGIKVGIIHYNYPKDQFNSEELDLIQCSIMDAVDQLRRTQSSQVRFENSSFRPGWLLVTCADEQSAEWLESAVNTSLIKPWDGAKLKVVVGHDIPQSHICIAFIPDDRNKKLTADVILARLKAMNHSLPTDEWGVLHREDSGPGQVWTFTVDEASLEALRKLEFRPYFGFGRVHFRVKNRRS